MKTKKKIITLSVRFEESQAAALQAIADRVGNGATPTGVLRQLGLDAIKAHEAIVNAAENEGDAK